MPVVGLARIDPARAHPLPVLSAWQALASNPSRITAARCPFANVDCQSGARGIQENMPLPTRDDWSFEEIRRSDPDRAARLEAPRSPTSHIASVKGALKKALRHRHRIYFAHEPAEQYHGGRAVLQFLVPPAEYDQFFNGRSGYRAHFWVSPAAGHEFNRALLAAVGEALSEGMPISVRGFRLATDWSRVGTMPLTKNFVLRSLDPNFAKCWVWTTPLQNGQYGGVWWKHEPTLRISRWMDTEGRFAPNPQVGNAWLEFKGGFLIANRARQPKSPSKRGQQLFSKGWT
jgi:hypothetical protein